MICYFTNNIFNKKGLWNIFTNYVDIIVNKRRRIVCFITMIGVKIMDDKKAQEQFKRGIKYNRIGFFIILLAIVPMALLEGLVKYILATIILSIGFYLERQYKCSYCGYVFDPKLKSNELIYCPKCSKKLQ